jgi:hypothetical protein
MAFELNKEKLWVAYLDGQLSASESVAFEATLSDVERSQAARELLLERAFGEALQEAPPCPDQLWMQVAGQIAAAQPRPSLAGQPRVLAAALISLAALTLFTFGDSLWRQRPVEPILALAAGLPEFEQQSSTSGELDAVVDFMRQRDVQLMLTDVATVPGIGRHPVRLVGASEQGCHGNSVVEIRFECCHKPVKVVLAVAGTKASSILQEGNRSGEVQHLRREGAYLIGVVSKHHAPDLTQLFTAA